MVKRISALMLLVLCFATSAFAVPLKITINTNQDAVNAVAGLHRDTLQTDKEKTDFVTQYMQTLYNAELEQAAQSEQYPIYEIAVKQRANVLKNG